mgnify:CR=1 FL=1
MGVWVWFHKLVTDERMRDSERLAATGNVAARADWLVQRVRAGELSSTRLQLAAYVGDEGALEALTSEEIPAPPARRLIWFRRPDQGFRDWVSGLAENWPRPKEIAVRVCVALVAHEAQATLTPVPHEGWHLVDFAKGWLGNPDLELQEPCPLLPYEVGLCLGFLRSALVWGTPEAHEWTGPARAMREAAAVCAKHTSPNEVRARLKEVLLEWALGSEES